MTHSEMHIDNWATPAQWTAALTAAAQRERARSSRFEQTLGAMVQMGRISAQQGDVISATLQSMRAELVMACAQAFEERVSALRPELTIERMVLRVGQEIHPAWTLHEIDGPSTGGLPVATLGKVPGRFTGEGDYASEIWQRLSPPVIEACASMTLEEGEASGRELARQMVREDQRPIDSLVITTAVLVETRELQHRSDYGQVVDQLIAQHFSAVNHG